jgi:hypothetical protein
MRKRIFSGVTIGVAFGLAIAARPEPVAAQRGAAAAPPATRPNVVIMLPDNLGWGEVGAYGSVRGVPTPRIDRMGPEGMRLYKFNVEY